jgi:hypothetical protein
MMSTGQYRILVVSNSPGPVLEAVDVDVYAFPKCWMSLLRLGVVYYLLGLGSRREVGGTG